VRFAAVAALRHVVGDAGNDDAREPGHADSQIGDPAAHRGVNPGGMEARLFFGDSLPV
jgi:hypothetical protein